MQISKTLRALADGTYGYFCPGCQELHQTKPNNRFVGGSLNKPSFARSIWIGNGTPRCHHNITFGKIIFFEDCRHKLKGSSVDLPDLPPEYQDAPRG